MNRKIFKKFKFFGKKTKRNINSYLKKIWQIIKKPEMALLPGELAFFMILSLVPIITLCGVGASSFGLDMNFIIENLNAIIPGDTQQIIPYLVGGNLDFKLSLLLIWMFFIASGGCNSMILISNQIYGIDQSNWFKRRIKAIIMTLAIVIFLLFLLIVPVYGGKILTLFPIIANNQKVNTILSLVRGPLTWIIIFVFIRALYEFAPDRVRKNSHINVGAFVTTVGWTLFTYIYRLIAQNMTTYNVFYGALSNIAVLMMWIYFLSFIMVLGMILNYGEEQDKEYIEKSGAIKVISSN